MGFISLGICIVAFPALLKGTSALAKARTARKLYDASAFKDAGFVLFTLCSFATFLGYVVPYFYISVYAQDVLGISRSFSLSVLIMALAASFFGRLSAGLVAHRLGPVLTWFWCAIISGVVSLAWMGVTSQNGLICFSVFWGFCSAGLVTLPAAVFPSLCPDQRRLGTRTGMSWGMSSFASLIGSPIAGAILKQHRGPDGRQPKEDFLGPQLWAGICLLIGGGFIAMLWMRVYRLNDRKSFFV